MTIMTTVAFSPQGPYLIIYPQLVYDFIYFVGTEKLITVVNKTVFFLYPQQPMHDSITAQFQWNINENAIFSFICIVEQYI